MPPSRRLGLRVVSASARLGYEADTARLYTKFLAPALFVHINKTGGSSVEAALGLPPQHRTAREMRADVGKARWDAALTFTVVRNPWDKVISHYRYRVKTNQTGLRDGHLSLSQWVQCAYGDHDPRYYDKPLMFASQYDWITDADGTVLVDEVLRFESLEQDFAHLCTRLGVSAHLPHMKASGNSHGREDYDATAAKIVADHFAKDIAHFGYEFAG